MVSTGEVRLRLENSRGDAINSIDAIDVNDCFFKRDKPHYQNPPVNSKNKSVHPHSNSPNI
jgi:hypothetical protein